MLRVSHSAAVAAWRGRERALRARGDDVSLITAPQWHAGGTWVRLDAADDEQVIPARAFGTHPALFLYDPRPIWRALGEQWDVIDIHEEPFALSTAEVLLIRMIRRNRAPFALYTAQNLHKRYPVPFRWLESWALRHASGVSACNTEAGRIVEAKGFPGSARVIPLGIEMPEAERPDAATNAHEDDGMITVGMLGRLVPEKGVTTLLDALALEPRLRARFGGSGPLSVELPGLAAERGVAERVELIGAVDPALVDDFYRGIDVLAVPSVATRRWTEQFGRVAIEAMALGVPVVSSDAGALPDVVGGAGTVVPAGNAEALAGALVEAAGPRRRELIAAGLERAAECSWDSVAGAYQELYRSMLRDDVSVLADRDAVEIIVVAYGTIGLLRGALEPVADHFSITVIDNSSLPEIAALCAELGIRYVDAGDNLGFGTAVNRVLSDRLRPDADVLILNPDAMIDPAGIATLHRALHVDPRLASVGPAQVDGSGHSARVEWPFPSPLLAMAEAIGLGRFARGPRFVIGSLLLLRAEALSQVGGFDERFFLYAEETDWAYRAHLLGWRHRAVPEVTALHLAGGTSADPRRREAHFFASQERYYRKHFGAAGWAIARVAGWAGAMARSAVLRDERRAQARRRAAVYRLGPVRVEARFRRAR